AAGARAGVRCGGERGHEPWVALLDLLQRHPPRLVHEVDEPEVARREHDDVLARDVVLRLLLLRPTTRRLADRVPDGLVDLVPRLDGGDVRVLERATDEVVETLAVALLEGCRLRLPVIREDDDLIGPGREPARLLDASE